MKAKLDLVDNNIVITFDRKPTNIINLQFISFYLFAKNNNVENSFIIEKSKINLNEIVKYLKENNLDLDLSKVLNDEINLANIEKQKFSEKRNTLIEFKKNIKTNEFAEYCKKLDLLNRNLKDHQKKASFHLYISESAANFSVPGSGKTSVVLSYYEFLKKENKVDGLFIIGPKNCFYSWSDEFKLTLGRDSNITILQGNAAKRKQFYLSKLKTELICCHFSLVTNDVLSLIDFFKKNRFLLVIDEAHNIKKIDGTWSKSALNLGNFAKYKVILTGTPIPNDFKDFYNYLDFLYGDQVIINDFEKAQIEVLVERGKTDEAADFINQKINPFYTIVTKRELGLLKPNLHKPILIKMNKIEGQIYSAIITKIKYFSKSKFLKNADLINKLQKARVIRLMQTCSYVKNLITAIPDQDISKIENLLEDDLIKNLISRYDELEKPSKITELKKIVSTLASKNKKVLIWSGHLRTIDLIKKQLIHDGLKIKIIKGDTSLIDRQDIKNEFNDKNSDLNAIIANPQACAESMSLHKACQNAVYYDLNYDTAEFLQSLDRIHRVGGSENLEVQYDFLQYENTVEQKVFERVKYKADRQMKIIDKENLTFSPDEPDDWNELYKDLNL